MSKIYKGIRDKSGAPIYLRDIVSLYRMFGGSSCEVVAGQLTDMGYKSKLGGPVNRHQVFRALVRAGILVEER